jgi:hypothetical protein
VRGQWSRGKEAGKTDGDALEERDEECIGFIVGKVFVGSGEKGEDVWLAGEIDENGESIFGDGL